MVIDGHAHSCGVYSTLCSIETYLNEHNIDKVMLCGGEPNSNTDYGYPMLSKVFKGDKLGYLFNKIICKVIKIKNLDHYIDDENKVVWQMAKSAPDRIMNAYWINPSEDNCIEKMEGFYKNYGFYMIKMHQCWTRFDVESEKFITIMKWAQEHNMIIFIHLLNKEQVRKFIEAANDNLENVMIAAHMIGISEMEKKLKSDNVYFDLSAPQLYSSDTLKKAIKRFGISRFIAGSDTPYGKNNFDIVRKRLLGAGLSENEVADICGNNINKITRQIK